MAKFNKVSFFICVYRLPLTKMGFERSALDVGIQGFYSSGVGCFQMGDLADKIGRVTGVEHSKVLKIR